MSEVSIMPPVVPPDAPSYERDAADLQVLSCRRTTLEWVLRRCALAEPSVRFEVGVPVDGLLRRGPSGAPLDVRGVRLADGRELPPTWSWRAPVGATRCRAGSPSTA